MSLNLADIIDLAAEKHPERCAMIMDDTRVSYGALASGVRKIAGLLRMKGIGPGDNVVMMLPNTPLFPIVYHGILSAGAVVIPINFLLKSHEIQFFLEDSEAKLFFTWHGFEAESVKAFQKVESCHHLIIAGADDGYEPPKGESLNALLEMPMPTQLPAPAMPDDTAVILYTSGTTGRPKGAELTHFNMFFNAAAAQQHLLRYTSEDVVLVSLPLFHVFGQTIVMNATLMYGATMTFEPSVDLKKAAHIISRDKVTMLAMVPSMYYFILNSPRPELYDFSTVRMALCGGSALPVEVLHGFKEKFGVDITEGYGLSETSPLAAYNPEDRPAKPGSIGQKLWGTRMAIMRDDGSFAEVGEVGEIVIRGHNIMKGYYKLPIATEENIVDGWFHTGDLAWVDEDGYFFIVDRKKDMIIVNGMNVYPREIEEVLYGHADVHEAAIVGRPHKSHGEIVVGYVALKEGATAAPTELQAYCRERLARYKCPREINILPALPKGPTGKILKRKLRETPSSE